MVLVTQVEPLRVRVMSLVAGRQDSSNNFRINVWLAALDMVQARPWLGIGPGNDVVFQRAGNVCQFTFACDGRSDEGTERKAWNRSVELADKAFAEFQRGERPDVVPGSVLYYHTTAVAPKWSHTFRRVASIGSHVFYSAN